MLSLKKRKRNQSDALYAKNSKVKVQKVNPFELKQNREKFDILNRRRNHSLGKPTVSRQQALDKRKQTIGVEYKQRNKSNLFQDSRKAGFKEPKTSIYNLNENEFLTHRGQTLKEVESFNDEYQDDDQMSDDDGVRLNGLNI